MLSLKFERMKHIVLNVIAIAFWLMTFANLVEFMTGFYESEPKACIAAATHYVLKDSWYAMGCRAGDR
jgi:hypothetical protein